MLLSIVNNQITCVLEASFIISTKENLKNILWKQEFDEIIMIIIVIISSIIVAIIFIF